MKKTLVRIMAVLVVVVAVMLVFGTRREIYLANGGFNYLVLRTVGFDVSWVEDTDLGGLSGFPSAWTVTREPSLLRLRQQINFSDMLPDEGLPGDADRPDRTIDVTLELREVTSQPGEWVLASVSNKGYSNGFAYGRMLPGEVFLQRVDDPLVLQCVEARTRLSMGEQAGKEYQEAASRLLARHPDKVLVRNLYLEACAVAGDADELERRVSEWRADHQKRGRTARLTIEAAEADLRYLRLSASGRNALTSFVNDWVSTGTDLQTRIKRLPEIWQYEECAMPVLGGRNRSALPSLLEIQIAVRVMRVMATLMLFEGRAGESLEILGACQRLGQLLSVADSLMAVQIGVAQRASATGGLAVHVLNTCQSPDDFDRAWAMLDRLDRHEEDLTVDTDEGLAEDAPTWSAIATARFRLLQLAVAGRELMTTETRWPSGAPDVVRRLPAGLPVDPFASGTLQMHERDGRSVCVLQRRAGPRGRWRAD